VEGTVIAIKESRLQLFRSRLLLFGTATRTRWIIRYHYQDMSGNMHRATSCSLLSDEVANWQVGDRGIIRIDPDSPSDSFWTGQPAHSPRAQ